MPSQLPDVEPDLLMKTPEQAARDMLERLGMDDAQSLTSGDVVELANLIAEVDRLRAPASKNPVKLFWMNAPGIQDHSVTISPEGGIMPSVAIDNATGLDLRVEFAVDRQTQKLTIQIKRNDA